MAQRMIERACDRFRKEISPDDARLIETTVSLDDVKLAICQIERQLAARQRLRDLDSITPFINAIERYSRALDVAANGTPFLPWIWAPLKLVLQAVQDYTHALDSILSAYSSIGLQMPRFTRFAEAFPEDRAFQQLLAFLFEDIMEFHRHVYAMIRKSSWVIFFKSTWGLFDHRFGSLLDSITRISDQIDREAMSIDIVQSAELRRKEAEASAQRETRWRTQQLDVVLSWLEASDTDQEMKLEWLRSRCYEGTLQWVTKSPKLRGWLQRGRGKQVLWLYGKPGSGKSVIGAQLISFLRADPNRKVCFFFCDFHTPTLAASGHVFRAITAQILRMSPDLAPYMHGEYVGKGQKPTTGVLKKLLPHLLARIPDIRLVVDGIDEISATEHRDLIPDLLRLTNLVSECKLLLISQDLPSISVKLGKQVRLSIGEEEANVRKDMAAIVEGSLRDIDGQHNGVLGEEVLQSLQSEILRKSEGMFLWVHLILELLTNAGSVEDLRLQISSLPATLAEAYSKILNNICSRCSTHDVARIRRIFAWLIYHKGRVPLRKHQVRIGISLFPGRDTLNQGTKPLPNTTDICKPLIEDGPGGSLVFVHSTVAQFLEEYGDAPFINRLESRASIAYACICQLDQGLDLLEPLSTSTSAIGVASGFFGLWSYSHEHWIEHMLDCFEANHETASESIRAVVDRTKRLCLRIIALDSREPRGDGPCQQDPSQDPRLSNFIAVVGPTVSRFVAELHKAPDDEGPLARVMRTHQEIVESLIRGKNFVGISCESLLEFKEIYGPIAFVCNVRGCERAIFGFPLKDELKNHQALHLESFRCYEKNCFYNDVGFPTARSLQDHNRKRHGTARLRPVPKRLRRVGKLSTGMEDDDIKNVGEEGDWSCIYNPQVRRKLQVNSCRVIQRAALVVCVRFSPDGKRLAAGTNKLVSIFDTDTGILLQDLDHGLGKNEPDDNTDMYVRAVSFSPDGKDVATGGEDHLLRIWDIQSGHKTILSGHEQNIYTLEYAANGRTIASGSGDRTVRLWDSQTRSLIFSLSAPEDISKVAISPNSRYVAAGCLDNIIHVFSIENGSEVAALDGPDAHKDGVYAVAFSPDSMKIVSGGLDNVIKIWDCWELGKPPRCLKTLAGHEDFVLDVSCTPNARWIVSGSKDREARFWDAQTGESQLSLIGHKNSVISVATSPVGNYVVTGSGDKKIRIWSYREL